MILAGGGFLPPAMAYVRDRQLLLVPEAGSAWGERGERILVPYTELRRRWARVP